MAGSQRISHEKEGPMNTKQCTKCKEIKDLSEFCKNSGRLDGLQAHCRDCNRVSRSRYNDLPPDIPLDIKTCARCEVDKPNSEFHKTRGGRDGLQTICKDCHSKNNKSYYLLPPDSGPISTKTCVRCKVVKNISEFSKSRTTKDGFMGNCRECDRSSWLMKKYGISSIDYNQILSIQNGRCAICKRSKEENTISHRSGKFLPLAVDHCHKTGIVRGLLCDPCNRAIGFMKEDIVALESAINYIKSNGFKK